MKELKPLKCSIEGDMKIVTFNAESVRQYLDDELNISLIVNEGEGKFFKEVDRESLLEALSTYDMLNPSEL